MHETMPTLTACCELVPVAAPLSAPGETGRHIITERHIMSQSQYTDVKIKTAIRNAKQQSDAKWLAPGQRAYLQLKQSEQALISDGIRELSISIPKAGPLTALEILAAIGAKWEKIYPLEPEA